MDRFEGKNVLITGAGGFIGNRLADRLLVEKANVVCLNRVDGVGRTIGVPTYTGDVADYDLMCEIISTNEIDYVFHLAANAIVRTAARDPMSTYRTNVMGTVALLEAVRTVGRCKKVVVASSDKAYGDHDVLPYVESMALQPKNTYDTSKACADLVARTFAQNYDLPIVVTRCSNVYGPGDRNMSRIIPNSITRILRGEPPVLYSDVAEMEREFIFIEDVLEANILLALSGPETNGQAFNIGGTGAHKIEDVVRVILSIMVSDLTPAIVQRDPVFKEIKRQYIDASKLTQATGWKPKWDLPFGLSQTIDWYRGES